MIRTSFRVARYIPGNLGPFTLKVDAIDCTLSLLPDAARNPPPAAGAEGNGAIVTMEHQPTAGLVDSELAVEAFELALKATNRVLHALAFAGGKRKPVPLLDREDLESPSCTDDPGGAARVLQAAGLFRRGPVRIDLVAADRTAAVQRIIDPLPLDFSGPQALWTDAVEAFYAGRLREAVVIARAALEVGWEVTARAAAQDLSMQVAGPVQPAIFDAYVDEGLDSRALKDRFEKYTKALLGFSFATDWDVAKWGQVITFFDLRNDVAHRGLHPEADDAWKAISLTREVLDKLVELRRRVAPPAGGGAH